MKKKFLLCKRRHVFYLLDSDSGRRTSLQTSDREEAEKIVRARNDSLGKPALGLALAKAYLAAYDPTLAHRTWQEVMNEFSSRGQPQTRALRQRRLRDKAFEGIRHKALVETTSQDFLSVLKSDSVIIHAFLRCLQNLALGFGWLPWPILAPKLWPQPHSKSKRGITAIEHGSILLAETNPERRLYYSLLWEIGASQTDAASLSAANIDWPGRTLAYRRMKTGSLAYLTIGPKLEEILRALPSEGPLFPRISATSPNARAAEFWRRCQLLGIQGVSLHSYRYAWAERARTAGFPERFAQEALGHNSKAVHRAYARGAVVKIPSLEDYEKKAQQEAAA
jgi:integrase